MLDFEGLLNFRDAGALAGRAGKLYRSDALCGLSDADRPLYGSLGIHTVIDLRRAEEIAAQGKAPDWAYVAWHNVTLREQAWPVGECPDEAAVAAYLANVYLGMSVNDIARVLTILADPQTGPAVVHCMGGRDRTGVVVALLLSLLGVPDEQIGVDYNETERFTEKWLEKFGQGTDLPPNLLYTPAEAILLYLAQVRERHGSVQEYLALDPAVISRLKERFSDS